MNDWIILIGVAVCLGLIIVTSTVDDEGSDRTIRTIISVINSCIVLLFVCPDNWWGLIERRGLIIAGLAFVNTCIAFVWFLLDKGDAEMFYGHLGCNIGLVLIGMFMRHAEKDKFKLTRTFIESGEQLEGAKKKKLAKVQQTLIETLQAETKKISNPD